MTKTFLMNTMNKFFLSVLFLASISMVSCVDNDFDEPENTFMIDDSNVITIDMIAGALDTTQAILLTDDILGGEEVFLKVLVTADDASGNLFKIVVFKDETGALSIIPDQNELNAEFPAGSIIYIKLNGLTLANSNGTPQLGYGINDDDELQRIPDLLVSDFMFLSAEKEAVTPEIITIRDFVENERQYLNKVVSIENVEFTAEFSGETFAISNAGTGETPISVNAVIADCDNNTLIVRNSGFSDFADDIMPMFNGTITGVLSKFGSDLQLFLRDRGDVMFDQPRCLDNLGSESIMPVSELVALSSDNFLFLDSNSTGREQAFVRATVIADDASGTFFKTLVVQDETGGIRLSLDAFDLFETYSVGDVVLVSLHGLTLQNDAGTPTLGDGEVDDRLQRIAEEKVGSVVINTGLSSTPDPMVVSVSEVLNGGNMMLNRLVTFERVELPVGEVGQPFAAESSRNIDLTDCEDDEILFRSSSFASFADELLPLGSGSFTGVTGRFLDDVQIFLREREDMNFDMDRCDGSGGFPDNEITIASIKDRFYSLGADESEQGFITGTVISDRGNSTFQDRNIVIQNGNDGIVVRFQNTHTYDIGTTLKIDVTGQELSQFNGLLQINQVPNFNAQVTGSGALPAPREVTVDEILLDMNSYESTLVKINDADLINGSTFADGPLVDDGTETIQLFTRFSASFANQALPSGMVDVTAIVGEFNNPQLIINSPADIEGGTVDPGGDSEVNQNFDGFGDFDPVSFPGWLNVATKGDRQWYTRSFDNNGFAECEAFQDDNPETEAWLVTPTIDTDEKSIFSFETAKAFWQHQGLTVWISPDFTNLADAQWMPLDQATIADNSVDNYVWVASGDIDLTDYLGGKVRVGWRYEGTAASNTTKMRIDNVVLK